MFQTLANLDPVAMFSEFSCTTVALALVLAVSVAVLWMRSERDQFPPGTKKIPGPWIRLPIIGYLPFLGPKPFLKMWQMSHKYGPVFQFRMGNRKAIVLNGFETIKEAYQHNAEAFAGRPDFRSSVYFNAGKSLTFLTYSPSWNVHRKAASRVLSIFLNNKHYPIDRVLQESALQLANELVEAEHVNPYRHVEETVISIVYRMCFGREDTVPDPTKKGMSNMLNGLREVFVAVQLYDILPTWLSWPFRRQLTQFKRCIDAYNRLANEKVDKILSADGGYIPGHPRCIVDALQDVWNEKELDQRDQQEDDIIDDDSPLTRDQLVATVQDLIGAGSETIVNFFNWAILYLAKYPDTQDRLRAVIREKIGTKAPTSSDRLSMPFVESFMWEVLRHCSLVPLALPHSTTCDVVLHGMFVPKNSIVIANVYSTGVDPAVWKNPEEFQPDRFLHADDGTIDRDLLERFLCFSVGRRKCLGAEFARQAMFVIITVLIQKCKFEPIHGQPPLNFDSTFIQTNSARPYFVQVSEA